VTSEESFPAVRSTHVDSQDWREGGKRHCLLPSIVEFLQRKPNKMQQCIKILLFLIWNEAQHVSGDTPPIIRNLKLHKQPLDLHNIVGRAVVGRCQIAYATWQRPTTARPTTFHDLVPESPCFWFYFNLVNFKPITTDKHGKEWLQTLF